MQPQTLQQTLAAVDALNKPDQPFHYRVDGNQIIGEWKYLDATLAAPLAAGKISKDFRVTVSFDEATHTFTAKDNKGESKSKISFNPLSGQISFGKSSEGFSGHMIGKEIGYGVGNANQPQNQTATAGTYSYRFDTSEIKRPLFSFLAQNGWQKGKTGFLSKIFGTK